MAKQTKHIRVSKKGVPFEAGLKRISKVYIMTLFDRNEGEITETKVFKTRKAAEEYVIEDAQMNTPTPEVDTFEEAVDAFANFEIEVIIKEQDIGD